jgi:hypothetical protein
MKIMWILLGILAFNVYGVECDCEIRVYSPTTASHQISTTPLKNYQLNSYDSYSKNNQWHCRKSCLQKFHEDMSTVRLSALLTLHSERLIEEGLVGFNCTGLTTFKYPVRVKASLGEKGLGNVTDQIVVVNHEERCF